MQQHAMLDRAQGCLLGQLSGDALGSLVEFSGPEEIRAAYPQGVREMADGGYNNTIAGQPTDDSEMALLLARMLVEQEHYDAAQAKKAYLYWLESGPFDCGITIGNALRGNFNPESQANGAMMRISPLGIFGASRSLDAVAEWARQDAAITHPNPVCLEANALYARAIALAVRTGTDAQTLYAQIVKWADADQVTPTLRKAIEAAAEAPPADYMTQMGWVLLAFHNALWQLLHASTLEEGVVDTIMRGGDTDTTAAICGALLGAVHGRKAIPADWMERVLNCRPEEGADGVFRPRPEVFWPVDALELAEKLLR